MPVSHEINNGRNGAAAVVGSGLGGSPTAEHALAVPDTEPWWRAVMAITFEAEEEALNEARTAVANERLCVNSLGAADGARLVREKMAAARERALQTSNAQRPTLNAQ